MVICHGAGSRKENHGDFGRACAAAGWAALAFDQRGHGDSSDEMRPAAIDDVALMARFLAGHEGVDAGRVCVRGSSMGGFVAIWAAAGSQDLAGVIAVCPAGEAHLLRGLRSGDLEMRMGREARAEMEAWLGSHDIGDAAARLGDKPLLLLHAEGDERIEAANSRELFARAAEPRKLIVVPGGHHRSVQHDAELQGVALRWLERNLARAG
jgi:pimeloyl-ACP methyl ester carboxylesterase